MAQMAGQERAQRLVQAWLATGRLPHAILICGSEGTGKRRFALELAKSILCRQGGVQACNACISCRKVERLSHPDLHALLPLLPRVKKSGGEAPEEDSGLLQEQREALTDYLKAEEGVASTANIAREQLRLLQRELSYTPAEGSCKIGLIFEAECMHPAGANSVLKLLEEPPGKTVILLVSTHPERLLPTVRSRCQRVLLQPLAREVLHSQLAEYKLPPERVQLAVGLAAGSLQRALQIARGDLDCSRELVEAFLLAAVSGRDAGYWSLLDELGVRNERGQRVRSQLGHLKRFLELCGLYLRDLLLLALGLSEKIALIDRREYLERLLCRFTVERIEAAAVEVDRAADHLTRNGNVQLALVDLWRCLDRSVAESTAVPPRSRAR